MTESGPGPRRLPRDWVKLTALGALSALWSLFLWAELVVSRAGGGSFCGFGGKFDCTAVWNGALASGGPSAERPAGVRLGPRWSVAAFVLALAGLARLASGEQPGALVTARSADGGRGPCWPSPSFSP